mgnify:CR=1 FL=1
MKWDLALGLSLVGVEFFGLFLSKVVERFNELLSKETFVLIEAVALWAKSGALDVLYFELDDFAGNRGNVNVEVSPHLKIIIFITAIQYSPLSISYL